MEKAEMQRARYAARKYGLRCRRVEGGYRFYTFEGDKVAAVNNVSCNEVLTFEGVQKFLATINAKSMCVMLNINSAVEV